MFQIVPWTMKPFQRKCILSSGRSGGRSREATGGGAVEELLPAGPTAGAKASSVLPSPTGRALRNGAWYGGGGARVGKSALGVAIVDPPGQNLCWVHH